MSDFEISPRNRLLSALSSQAYQSLLPDLQAVSLTSGEILHKSLESAKDIYFPETAVFSLTIDTADGSISEILSIGKEGIVGLPAIFGDRCLATNSIVLLSGTAWKIESSVARRHFYDGGEFQMLTLLYTQAYIAHASHISACNSLHTIEQRLARFLLLVQDTIEQETLPLTQKIISLMLGVRRASITETAIYLQSQKIIKYSRGKITILDRSRLEAIACECYAQIERNYRTLF